MATIGCPLLVAIWSTFRSPHHHPCLLRGRPRQRGSSNRSVVDTNNNKADKISSNKTSYNDDYQVLRRNEHGLPAIIMGDDLGHIGVFHNAKEAMAMLHNHEVVHENAKRSLLRIMTREGGEGGGGGDGAEFYVPGGSTNNTSDFSMGSNLVAKGKPQMSKDGSMHVRFQHEINGYLVEDAFLMVHTNPRGQIVAVNGEFVRNAAAAAAASDHLTTPVSSMMLDAPTARAMAMREAGINVSDIIVQEDQLSSQPTLAMVVDSNTGEACLAWKCIVEHSSGLNHHDDDDDSKNNTMSSPSTSFQRDAIYADVHDGHLCARHPQIVGLASEGLYPRHYYDTPPALDGLLRPGDGPVIQTMACEPKSPSSPIYNERYCYLYSNATRPISPNDNDDYYYPDHEEEEEALCKAHNHALATYRYFWNNHGLWSFNGQGMPVVSFVLNREFAFDSAYWNGASVTFGDGLSEYNALSLAADVVAHEFVCFSFISVKILVCYFAS
jgi:Thermolysin metallopeptidase, catalytic domain/Fungalysin/Thermolysin Propeptide Motif